MLASARADGTYITTIDGNTGSASEDNGGAVLRRRRHKKFIVGAYRPEYQEDDDMTQDQFDAMMENWMSRQAKKKPTQQWEIEGLERVVKAGVTDGSRPMGLCTRLEAAMMAAANK